MTERLFTSREVAELAGINPATFRSYFRSGHFRVIGSMERKDAAKDGLAHIYGWHEAMGFAVAQTLIKRGAHPKTAFYAAFMHFAMTGDETRSPGELFDVRERGLTFMAFDHESGKAHVFSQSSQPSIEDIVTNDAIAPEKHTMILTLNYVERAVQARFHEMRDFNE